MQRPVAAVSILLSLGIGGGAAAFDQQAPAACSAADLGSDRMGVRAKDAGGNWRYITVEDIMWIEAARFSGMPSLYMRLLDPDRMRAKFGPCADAYLGPASSLLGMAVGDREGRLASGQVAQLWIPLGGSPPTSFQPQPLNLMALYATGGSPLIRYRGHLYAVHERSACAIAPPERLGGLGTARRAVAEPCTPDARSRLTGVVRQMADRFAELGVTRVDRSDFRFEGGRLRADLRVRTAAGRQDLHFEEE